MEDRNRVYRIRTTVGDDAPNVIQVPLNQTYDMFEILSLKLNQTNSYKTYESSYGVIVGRVIANGGFGIENAKISVFIPVSDDDSLKDKLLYNFTSVNGRDDKGIRYNLLPDYVDDACHQNVGTFPNKRLVLDNDDIIEMFDKYWKYTTRTNHSGDYMLFGIPTGSAQIHCDVDLSDCGILSQRPRDMINKGYNATMFENPNKFKSSTNLNSLAQIVSQDKGVYVYPYWGDISDGDDKFGITRCDINIEYKFESYAVFMGSIITDKGSNAIGKNCTGTENNGKMSDLIAGEGTIEMIRKTLDGKVEEFPIMGNRLIDSDGVWCYAIPMNLDYVTTDEFGNLIPTDNPDKGIATRTRARFRISLDENPNDATARKRARYLVPNNPRMGEGEFDETLEADYEFGSATREESYCDMFWNKVYTVKNYIPKLQKNSKETNRKHTGIKLINHYGDNNPMPYNALTIKLSFTYRLICVITKVIINLIEFVNEIISIIGGILCLVKFVLELPKQAFKIFRIIPFIGSLIEKLLNIIWDGIIYLPVTLLELIMPNCIGLSSEFCDDGVNQVTYYPGCGYFLFRLFKMPKILDCVWGKTKKNHESNQLKICENEQKTPEDCEMSLTEPINTTAMLYNCVENQLAQQNDATSFNFNNDWVNGVLYAPLWYRKITPKKRFFFGLFNKKAKDEWCSSERYYPGTRIIQQCTLPRTADGTIKNFDGQLIDFYRVKDNNNDICDGVCHKRHTDIKGLNGVILAKETMLGQTVYYYKAVEYDRSLPSNIRSSRGEIKLLFATDIVLLGSLNECDMNGIPQFFKTLESSTYNLPTDILFTDYDFIMTVNKDGNTGRQEYTIDDIVKTSEMAGCDWGNPNEFGKSDGGLFYSLGCTSGSIKLNPKSCINLARICEYGVSLDETKEVADLNELQYADDDEINGDNSGRYFDKVVTDGFISWDELYNLDERSMFATMNGNKLKTKLNIKNGLQEYDFRYLYPENFDGSLKEIMQNQTKRYSTDVNYKNNYNLETPSKDYYLFRMGNNPYYYDSDNSFPRYENSFYFYFGLKAGKTAIEKFNSKYFAECNNLNAIQMQIGIRSKANSWCSKIGVGQEDKDKGYNTNNDGYLALDLTGISTPYNLLINGETNSSYSIEINNIVNEKIILINDRYEIPKNLQEYVRLKDSNGNTIPMMDNGSYIGVITDNTGNITEFKFKINGQYLTFKANIQNFEQPNNVLWERFQNYLNISSNKDGLNNNNANNIQREIGGVVTICDIFNKNNTINFYSIDVRPVGTIKGYNGVSIIYYKGDVYIWKDNEPKKKVDTNETHAITDNDSLIWYDNNHHYAFGLPKGKETYSITISQLCGDSLTDGVTSGNSVIKNIFVDEPLPYKMYINDIDYDVIKFFDNYTGWNLEGKIKSLSAKEGSLDIDNPWFKVDNIYYNDNFKNFIEFNVTKDDESNSYNIIGVSDNGNETNLNINNLIKEFCTNSDDKTTVPYNWVDDYIVSGYEEINWNGSSQDDKNKAYENIDSFIKDVNSIMQKRRELVSMMKETFFLSCENDSKDIVVRGQTDKKPCTQTIVYHKEKAVEFKDYNELDGSNLIVEDSDENGGQITDIRIPTISYHSSLNFGDGGNDAPCLAQVNNIKKKPYSVGIMNDSGVSIPTKDGGKSFSITLKDGVKYINHDDNKLIDLFNFPIIDNILKFEYIVWSAFVNIPQYGYDNGIPRQKAVTMNGILSGIVCNGNVINDKFVTQTLNNITLNLSNNVTDKTVTYIEKRVINGFNVDEVGTWVISFLRSLVSVNVNNKILNYINGLFGFRFTDVNELYNIVNSLSVKEGKIVYTIDDNDVADFDIGKKLDKILSFTNYITLDNRIVQGQMQYAFVLPIQTLLILQDENGCGVNEVIDGKLTVDLSSNAINNCRDNVKVLEVESDQNVCYSIFKAGTNGEYYPLNKAEDNNIIWQITEKIYGSHSNDKPQNLFSFQTKTEHLRDKGLVDKNFKSQTLISEEAEQEEYKTTVGYGTNGIFTPQNDFNYPVFIVSETNKNVRSLSPVYDYSNVVANVKYGILERGEVKATDKEDGTKEYNMEVVKDYKFGISINSNETEQFYLLNYDYKLSGICKLDSINNIEVQQETLSVPNQYIFTTITENLYNIIKSRYGSNNSFIEALLLKTFKNNTEIIAYDYTGLKHICDIKHTPFETTWYSCIWNVNVPEGLSKAGIKVNENEFSIYEEDYYEKGTPLNEVTIYTPISEEDNIRWYGWSENIPFEEGGIIINEADWYSIIGTNGIQSCKVFYGNWKDRETLSVRFFESNGITQIGDTVSVAYDATVMPPDGYIGKTWYVKGDITKTAVNFSTYKIQKDTDFVLREEPSTTTISIPWRFENNRSGGDSVQTMKTTFTNGYYFSGGGGIQPHGGNRTGIMEVPSSMQTEPFVVESVEVVPNYTEPTAYKIIQTPNPYYYNGDTTTLLVSIEDA